MIPAFRPKVELGPSESCCHRGRSGHFARNCRAPIPVSSAGKHFYPGLQQQGSDELYDWNFDDDPFVNDNLFDLYSKFGITKHEMREDVYDNVADSTIVGSPPVPSCCSLLKSCILLLLFTQGPVHVKGHLKNHLDFWQRIKAYRQVISVISDGYALPFIELPPRNELKNHKSAFKEETFVSEQIMELLSAGCVTETNWSDVHVISPLGVHVVRNGSEKRLILDFRYVNNNLQIPKFKYSFLFSAGQCKGKGSVLFSSSPIWSAVCPLCFHKNPKSPC